MGEIIHFASAKGGAGATACAYRIGCALSDMGERTLLIDGDGECADMLNALSLGGMNVYTLADAAGGGCRIRQAILKLPDSLNLFLLPTLGCTDENFISQAARECAATFDYVLCDGCAQSAADRAVVVTEPYPSSINAADKKIARLKDGGMKDVGVIINKVDVGFVKSGKILPPREIAAVLGCRPVGTVPFDMYLPLDKTCRRTQRAFYVAAEVLAGRSEKPYGIKKAPAVKGVRRGMGERI